MNQYVIDPIVWFGNRELPYKPKHFVVASTPLTSESIDWIVHNIKGRYTLKCTNPNGTDDFFMINPNVPAFEDPSDLVLYELRWS